MYLSATVKRFIIGIYRRTSDDSNSYIIDRNVVGKSSVYTNEFPTNVMVIDFIGLSSELRRYIATQTLLSESRRYILTNFRRYSIFCFRRNAVGKSSNLSNIGCFLVVGDGGEVIRCGSSVARLSSTSQLSSTIQRQQEERWFHGHQLRWMRW